MPTGYTAKVADGSITELKPFVLSCARAFGAFAHMRDDPFDAPLTVRPLDTYHASALAKAEAENEQLRSLTDEQWRERWRAHNTKQTQDYRDAAAKAAELHERYNLMLAMVTDWKPPTDKHRELKEFMLRQLRESVDFDCHAPSLPKHRNLPEFKAECLDDSARYVRYQREEAEKENERHRGAREWAEQLFASFGVPV